MRLSLPEVAGDKQTEIIDAIWKAGWQQGRDIGDKVILAEILEEINVSADNLTKTEMPHIKDKLKQNTADAIALGVFGVPTFITEDKTLFWGVRFHARFRRLSNWTRKFRYREIRRNFK